jgi:hypothetical protein
MGAESIEFTCEVNDVIASIASDSAISMSHLDFRLLPSDFGLSSPD